MTNRKAPSGDITSGDFGHLKLSEHLWQGSWFHPRPDSWQESALTAVRRLAHRLFGGSRLTQAQAVAGLDLELLRSPLAVSDRPTVTVLIPARDAADYLPRCFDLLLALDYPRDRLRVIFGHGNSRDDSGARIAEICRAHGDDFAEVRQVEIRNNAPRVGRHRRALPKFQRHRRAGIARARNELLGAVIDQPTDWYLWIDADLDRYPPWILTRLLEEREKIVTPNCLMVGLRSSFDLNAFLSVQAPPDVDFYKYLKGGLFQPPDNYWGRRHLHDLRYLRRIPLHSVGGTMLLVAASVHKAGLAFPDQPYKGVIETEAFGLLAREMGVTPIGLPQVEIYHG